MIVKSRGLAWYTIFVLLTLAGCGTTEPVAVGREEIEAQVKMEKAAPPSQDNPYKIPPEYMPPPGKCRIWFPGRPPEYQPPPGECAELERQAPMNTWLLHGPRISP
jgi:hypothetical protein